MVPGAFWLQVSFDRANPRDKPFRETEHNSVQEERGCWAYDVARIQGKINPKIALPATEVEAKSLFMFRLRIRVVQGSWRSPKASPSSNINIY